MRNNTLFLLISTKYYEVTHMKIQKKYLRVFAFLLAALLCVVLPLTLAACGESEEPTSANSDDTTSETPETPKTDAEKFIDAMNAYETYFSDISDAFGTKLPAASDRGTTDLKLTIPVFSIFGESQTDVLDPDQPVLNATIVQAGDLASLALTTVLYGEQLRVEVYESATEGILVFPDLPDQAPIRLTAEEAAGSLTDIADVGQKLLDSLDDDYSLTVKEDGDTCNYVLRLTAEQVVELVSSIVPSVKDILTDEDYMLYELTTVNGLPTELRTSLYIEGGTKVASEIGLKTSVTGSNTTIDMTASAGGETLLTANAVITATQGSIALNATLDMGETKLTANVKLLSESESAVTLDGTAEVRMAMDEGANLTLPLTVKGKIKADGDARETELEVNSSSTGMFDLTLRFEARFTPGETSVTMPEGAVDAEQVDSDALMEALTEAYPGIMGLFGDDNYDYQIYMSEDMTVEAAVEDGTIYLYALALECVDDGKSLTFSYNGKSLGSYAYKAIDEDAVECHGMTMYVTDDEDGGRSLYFEGEGFDFIWMGIELFEGEAAISFCMPYETADGVTKILLPDGTALPFDVILPEDETSSMQIGSLTLPRYVDSDPV